MLIDFLENASINTFKGFCNTLLNGFASDISNRSSQVGLRLAHFNPVSQWSIEPYEIIDKGTNDTYCKDSSLTLRLKCTALFAASFIVQPIGLSLNLLNRTAKIVSFAQLWNPSPVKYNFNARIAEWGKDILLVITTPLILVGMFFSALYGAILCPYDGRKLYGSFERLAYSGGYQFLNIGYMHENPHNFLLAPCFQPDPQTHLGGGQLGQSNVW